MRAGMRRSVLAAGMAALLGLSACGGDEPAPVPAAPAVALPVIPELAVPDCTPVPGAFDDAQAALSSIFGGTPLQAPVFAASSALFDSADGLSRAITTLSDGPRELPAYTAELLTSGDALRCATGLTSLGLRALQAEAEARGGTIPGMDIAIGDVELAERMARQIAADPAGLPTLVTQLRTVEGSLIRVATIAPTPVRAPELLFGLRLLASQFGLLADAVDAMRFLDAEATADALLSLANSPSAIGLPALPVADSAALVEAFNEARQALLDNDTDTISQAYDALSWMLAKHSDPQRVLDTLLAGGLAPEPTQVLDDLLALLSALPLPR